MNVKELKQFESVYQPSKEIAYCWGVKKYVQLCLEQDYTDIVDHANDSLRIWQAANAQAVSQEKGRSDFEIISQTIELVDLLASANRFQRDKSRPFPFDSNNPRNIEWWRLACKIQELLTNTDPNNCDFDEYKAMIEAAQEKENE